MPYTPDSKDPFYGGEKTPSLSWKSLPVGTIFTVKILEPAKALQSTNFETGEMAYWDKEHTRPIMAAVLNVLVLHGPHSVGEKRSIWATIPSNLFAALKQAQVDADAPFMAEGILHLKFVGETPHQNPRFNAIKQYAAKYEPPAQATQTDPFATPPPVAAGTPPAPQPGMQTWQGAPRPQAPSTSNVPNF